MRVSFTCRLDDIEAFPVVSRVCEDDLQAGSGTIYNVSKVEKGEESTAIVQRCEGQFGMTIKPLFAQLLLTSRVSQLLQTLSTPVLWVPVSAGDLLAWKASYPPALEELLDRRLAKHWNTRI